MKKENIRTISEKNRIIDNIIDAIVKRNNFLMLGHQNPDEDCIASMVSFGLILSKFYKDAKICLGTKVHEHFQYLLNICKYNAINVFDTCSIIDDTIDTLVICDTPKSSMIEKNDALQSLFHNKDILKIEFDHHIGADSEYIGDDDYCLVTEATSSSELVGHLALKLRKREDLLSQYQISNIFSRNLVLSILSGIIGDTQMGQFIKSRKEKRYYDIFSTMLNTILARETVKETNFASIEEVYQELQRLSTKEDRCYNFFIKKKRFSPSIGYIALNEDDTEELNRKVDKDTIVSVARAVANELAERSGKLSMVAYYDSPEISDLIQFRIRRSQSYNRYDLRNVLDLFSIENGGGHEGAIGFRIPRNQIGDFNGYVEKLINGLEKVIHDKE